MFSGLLFTAVHLSGVGERILRRAAAFGVTRREAQIIGLLQEGASLKCSMFQMLNMAPPGRLIALVSVVGLLVILAAAVGRRAACRECGACQESCPMSIDVAARVKSSALRTSDCILCASCAGVCPRKAIRLSFRSGHRPSSPRILGAG
jgi:NAD-dependent dihydropyrimidine dehydrogenase PreA subunit